MRRSVSLSKRPGMLTPIPSILRPSHERIIRRRQSISGPNVSFASGVVTITSCDVNFPFASASAIVVWLGRISTPMITRSSFKRRNVGRRPRGNLPVRPSSTQFSPISCSTIREIVLRCIPETLARSARDTGCRVRIRLSTIRRLISRMTSLDAVWASLAPILIKFLPVDLSRKGSRLQCA